MRTAAMGSAASAVEPTAAMEFTAAARRCAMESRIAAESSVKSAGAGTSEHRAAMEAAAIESVEPWTGADKDPARKIAGAIVTVRSASIRREPIVAIGADRSRTDVDRANLNRDLCMGRARHHHEKPYQSNVL